MDILCDIVIGLESEEPWGNLCAYYDRMEVLSCRLRVVSYGRTKPEGKTHSESPWFII